MTTRQKSRNNERLATLARGRTLHLVDIENVCGTGVLTSELVWGARALLHASEFASNVHHWVVGASSSSSALALIGWQDARRVVQHGKDGADLALLSVLDEQVTSRFSHVVVYSGDGIFADPLARIAAGGVDTTVVARPEQLSARLRLSARHVVLLPSLVEASATTLAA
ncbi:NYN domain-containing protein [Isoptericola sp. NPDC019571]|uniref:NYN domain-containing protein n=1 Tax=Isoptericola sp. NPDC019571 TaxID=3364008 RepID=UPI0037AC6B99